MGVFDAAMSKTFDVIVVGAALNGLTASLALGGRSARHPLSVALIDRKEPRKALAETSGWRASAITQLQTDFRGYLGVWEGVAQHMQEMGEIIVTDGRGLKPGRCCCNSARSGHGTGLIGPHGGETTICCGAF